MGYLVNLFATVYFNPEKQSKLFNGTPLDFAVVGSGTDTKGDFKATFTQIIDFPGKINHH